MKEVYIQKEQIIEDIPEKIMDFIMDSKYIKISNEMIMQEELSCSQWINKIFREFTATTYLKNNIIDAKDIVSVKIVKKF